MELVKYEAAKAAVAEARRVDEAKNIRDKAEAVRVYAKLAGDFDMQNWAMEIRLRAEHRAGDLLAEMKRTGARDAGQGGDRKSQSAEPTVKLEDLGISKDQSSQWQMWAQIPEPKFYGLIEQAREHATERNEELTTAAVLDELAADDDRELGEMNLRLRGLASSAIDSRPGKRGTYRPRRDAAERARDSIVNALEQCEGIDAEEIVEAADSATAKAWRKEIPGYIEFLKEVLDGLS